MFDPLWLRSAAFPAGTLLESYLDRDVTRLSDRGMASNMIGDRWSELCDAEMATWPDTERLLPTGESVRVSQVFRLDAIPEIASIASRRKLQNPDFIVVAMIDSRPCLMAVDAKFSIETAKPPQVSAETLSALLEVGPLVTDLLPGLPLDANVRDGMFMAPDIELNRYVLGRSRGRLSARVSSEQTILVPVNPVSFLKPLEGARLIGTLASRDDFRNEIRSNMLLALYYFRLVRACYGSYGDITSPIFGRRDVAIDASAEVEQRTLSLAHHQQTAWDVVLAWDAQAESIRNQRDAAYAAMPFPLANKEIRDRIEAESKARGLAAPSINSVRKRLGSWYRHEFDERVGVVLPPVDDLPSLIQRIHAIAREIEPLVVEATDSVIEEVFAAQPSLDDVSPETA